MDSDQVERIVHLARSLTRLQTERWGLVEEGEGKGGYASASVHPSIGPWSVGGDVSVTHVLLSPPSVSVACEKLRKELQLEFKRTQNRMLFDKTVKSSKGTFSYVSVPQRDPDPVPPQGMCSDVPPFPFQAVRDQFQFLTLFTSLEAVEVVVHVRSECSKVMEMNLFHTGGGKPLKLEEFETTQLQACNQVRLARLTRLWCACWDHFFIQ